MKVLLITLIASCVFGCYGSSSGPKVQADLEASITKGLTRELAERKLETLGFDWEYDKEAHVVRAIRRDPAGGFIKEALIVRIWLDSQSRVEKMDIERAYTGP